MPTRGFFLEKSGIVGMDVVSVMGEAAVFTLLLFGAAKANDLLNVSRGDC